MERTIYTQVRVSLCKCVGKEGGGGAEAPPDFKLMLLCVQAVTAKGHPKCWKTKEEKNSFQVIGSVTHTKSKLRSVQIYKFGSHYVHQIRS